MATQTVTVGVAAALVLFAVGGATPSAFEWRVEHPDGRVTTGSGEQLEWRPLMPGDHRVELTIHYAHEDPAAPGETYSGHVSEVVTVTGADMRRVFVDSFEDGTTARWSRTQGGSHE